MKFGDGGMGAKNCYSMYNPLDESGAREEVKNTKFTNDNNYRQIKIWNLPLANKQMG